jgi:hypothetical protein
MWARVPREDGLAVKVGDAFKLAEKRFPQDAAQMAELPMTHIIQGAVKFSQDLRQRQLADAQNKKSEQQTLGTSANRPTILAEDSRSIVSRLEGTKSNEPAFSQAEAHRAASSDRAQTRSPEGYSARGYQARPASTSPARTGSLLDLMA